MFAALLLTDIQPVTGKWYLPKCYSLKALSRWRGKRDMYQALREGLLIISPLETMLTGRWHVLDFQPDMDGAWTQRSQDTSGTGRW